MPITQNPTLEQWLLLGVFFLLFAIYGFTRKAKYSGCRPCYYIFFGILAIVGNALMLFIANRAGLDNFNLVKMITLEQTTLESSFIVLGYCLIIHGTAMLIKSFFVPASVKASRSFL